MGCIFYELLSNKKAFKNDAFTREFPALLPTDIHLHEINLDEIQRNLLSHIIWTSLNVTPGERPTAKIICDRLRTFLGLSDSDTSIRTNANDNVPLSTHLIFLSLKT
jgi:hypothetical protein